MKEVIAIIRMNMIQATKRMLADRGFPSVTVERVFGRGKQKGLHITYGNINPDNMGVAGMRYMPKRMLTMVVPDEQVDELVDTLMDVNRTGMIGDGKIFVCPLGDAIRIRTGEAGEEAI